MADSTKDLRHHKKADYYNDPGYNYKDYWVNREYEQAAEKMAITRLLEGKHFKHAVDIGGGYGRISVFLEKYADHVTLAEPSQQQLDVAEDYLKGHHRIEHKLMQADNLEFADGSVDLALMIRVLHHLPDPTAEFTELARVLSRDGYAVLEIANYLHARNRLKLLLHRRKPSKDPVDIRTQTNDVTPFVNHNPKTVTKQLSQAGLKVERILSVSNLRSPKLKKVMPRRIMLAIEGILQPTLARGYFGPSVFFLVRKAK